MTGPKLYGELADWFHVLTHPSSYAEEAATFVGMIDEHAAAPVRTVLELGSGGGNNASHMKARYEMTLTDLSPQMLDVSRTINPECDHHAGDMRTLRLDRTFDAVFVHDAISYLTTEEDLRACIQTAHAHLEPGGLVLLVPDETTEHYEPDTSHGGHDADGRSLRYLEWTHPIADGSTTYDMTMVYVLREDGAERVEVDRHTFGVFPQATWLRLLDDVGFDPTMLPYRHSEVPEDHETFVGIKR